MADDKQNKSEPSPRRRMELGAVHAVNTVLVNAGLIFTCSALPEEPFVYWTLRFEHDEFEEVLAMMWIDGDGLQIFMRLPKPVLHDAERTREIGDLRIAKDDRGIESVGSAIWLDELSVKELESVLTELQRTVRDLCGDKPDKPKDQVP